MFSTLPHFENHIHSFLQVINTPLDLTLLGAIAYSKAKSKDILSMDSIYKDSRTFQDEANKIKKQKSLLQVNRRVHT
jgi:hypothetical protein